MTHWPHSPAHFPGEASAFIVTAGTYRKELLFQSPARLSLLRDTLFHTAELHGWQLQAWAVMANHYHFVAFSPPDPSGLPSMILELHSVTAREINTMDGTPGRKVWYQYWDTLLTYQRAYLARLKYVHQNPVHHGLVAMATDYPWCSAAWFEQGAEAAFYRMVSTFKIDRVNVLDDF